MATPTTSEVPRDSTSRDIQTAAVTALVVRDPRLAGVRTVGSVLAECALGFA
jgi:hypothetical protein